MSRYRSNLALLALSVAAVPCATAQEYLYDDREPPDVASELPTPFTPYEAPKAEGYLRSYSSEPFIRDAVLSLRPRFYYRSVRNGLGVQDTFAGGGSLGITTGWWRDTLQFGVTGYTTQPLVAVTNNNRSGLVESDGDGFFTLGEAWGKVKVGPATGTAFRQILALPFINANDARMIPNTFEAYCGELKPWSFLRIDGGYVTRMKPRDTPDFVPMSEVAGAPQVNRGTGFLGFEVGSEDKTYLGAMTELTWDLFSASYAQAGHTWKISPDFEIRGDAQFADQRSVGDELIGNFETQLYGARVASSYGGALLSLSYTNTTKGSNLRSPYGSDPGFNGLMISNFTSAGEQTYGVALSYDFGRIGLTGLTAFASYVYGALPSDGWEQEVNVTADYRIGSGVLDNLWLRLRYAHNESTVNAPIDDFRVILNYTFNF